MADLDKAALMDAFFTAFDETDPQILVDNQPSVDLDDTKPWMRFVVDPGACEVTQLGINKRYHQLGVAILQIFVPAGLGAGPGDDLREQFNDAFRALRSADRCLRVYRIVPNTIRTKDAPLQINVTAYWESIRTY